jgi:hypothetical protein
MQILHAVVGEGGVGKEEQKDKGEGCCCKKGCALWLEVVSLEVEQKRGKGRLAEEKKRKPGKR